jgi:hypothetical protein
MSIFQITLDLKKKYYEEWDNLKKENEIEKKNMEDSHGNPINQTIEQHEEFITNQLNYINKLRELTNLHKKEIQQYQQDYEPNISQMVRKVPLYGANEDDYNRLYTTFINQISQSAGEIQSGTDHISEDIFIHNNLHPDTKGLINYFTIENDHTMYERCNYFINEHLVFTDEHFVVLVDGENLIQKDVDIVTRVLQQINTYAADKNMFVILVLKRDPLRGEATHFVQLFLDFFKSQLVVYFIDSPRPLLDNKPDRSGDDFLLLLLFMVIKSRKIMRDRNSDGSFVVFNEDVINMNPIMVTSDMSMKNEFYQYINNGQYNMCYILEYTFEYNNVNDLQPNININYFNLSLVVILNMLLQEGNNEIVLNTIFNSNSLAVLNPYDFVRWTRDIKLSMMDEHSIVSNNAALIQKYAITQKNVIQDQQGGSIIPFYW